jgi:putative colanic acid biosynthesis acetyltransferase WcaF
MEGELSPRERDASLFYRASYENRLSRKNQIARLVWGWVWLLLFRPSPVPLFAWRAFLLRLFGARMAPSARVYPSVRVWAPWNLVMEERSCLADRVDCYCVDRIHLASDVTVSQDAFLCTAGHDIHRAERPLVTAPIRLGAGSWVFARAIIAPGVTVAEGAVVALGAVVVRDVPAFEVVGGNPARRISERKYRGNESFSEPRS